VKYPLKSIDHGGYASWTKMAAECLDGLRGIAKMAQEESRINQVESFAERRLADVQLLEPDVPQAGRRCLGTRQLQLRQVDIDADHMTTRPNPASQVQGGITTAAASIKAGLPLVDAHTIEER
jgi:hypothetical protein